MRIQIKRLRKILTEALAAAPHPTSEAELTAETAVGLWTEETRNRFEMTDASMMLEGREAWNEQVERASDELRQRFAEAIIDVENELLEGEFRLDPRNL
jgi:hypothetical protein